MSYTTVVTLIFVVFALIELRAGRFLQPDARWRDTAIDVASGLVLPMLVVPAVFTASPTIVAWVWPNSEGALASWPWWAMFGVLLLADDLTQYLYHRASHAIPWLFRLHRAHHSAPYISIRVTYRNNFLYYAMMPGLWLSAALVHAGFAPVYYWYVIAKMLVVTSAHSSVGWDDWLLARRRLGPLLWILQRVISTPSTHAAHHGRHATDRATFYKGNYGNFLFLWDVMLGTAHITNRRPAAMASRTSRPQPGSKSLPGRSSVAGASERTTGDRCRPCKPPHKKHARRKKITVIDLLRDRNRGI